MATSSITRNFVVEGEEQVEMFANAIEESWQESLVRVEKPLVNCRELCDPQEVARFIERQKKVYGCE